MIALLLCGIIAGACAAPHFNEFPSKTPQRRPDFEHEMSELLEDLEHELSKLENFDSFVSDSPRFPSDALEEVEGTKYKITVPMYDFKPKDIVVNISGRVVEIKLKDKNDNTVSIIKIVPDNVNLNGNWILENGVLKITFPLKDGVVVKTTDGSREKIKTDVIV
ncbi:hypothetical protein PYW07_010130 [Mythimna separata]|uniref:SHSP domain-containing protein n=1 Tax=Mythimna separata TaxID=271217 RepID=A0AAD7YI11_MYTSE|nr:hypothetical protein PYW07_010130 [Mythimna separata]